MSKTCKASICISVLALTVSAASVGISQQMGKSANIIDSAICSPTPEGSPCTAGTNGTNGTAGTNGSNGTAGTNGTNGAVGPTGAPGTSSPAPYTALATDLIPSQDNVFTLGTASMRWKSLQLGPGTLFLEDVITGIQAGLTVSGGSLLIDGADSLRIGNIRLTANGLESVKPSQDIQIGSIGDTGYLSTARGIKFPDGTTQQTATLIGEQGKTGETGQDGAPGGFGSWGSFLESESQLNSKSGSVNFVSLSKTISENGVRITGEQSSRITFINPGTYNISFSLQMDNTDGFDAGEVEIWLTQNGVDVPDSNTKLILPTRTKGAYVAAWNFFVTTKGDDDFVELAWASTELGVKILGLTDEQTTYGPAIPSAIVTVNQIG